MKKFFFCYFLFSIFVQADEMTFVGQDYPPFNWKEENSSEVKGCMRDILESACKKLGHKCHFDIMPLKRALLMMENGEIDGVMALTPNTDRAVYSNSSQLLVASKLSYLAKKNNPNKVQNITDLNGWKVGAVRGATSTKVVQGQITYAPKMTVIEELGSDILVKKIEHDRYGEKGAIAGGEDMLKFVGKKNNVELKVIYSIEPMNFMNAFSKKKVDLKTFQDFKRIFSQMRKNGELKQILEKYSLKIYQEQD